MTLHLTGLRLWNFLPFRGEQEVALGPGVYALVAERDGDARRSNAQGKSSFLWAVRFLLTGDHPKRTEDDWITDGESEGGVDGELSDGTFVSRTRKRGGSTKLKVVLAEPTVATGPDDSRRFVSRERELLGVEAQAALDRFAGTPVDQSSTWWVGQKEVDSFLKADPADLTRVVSAWVGLDPVRAAAARVAEELRGLDAGYARLSAVAGASRDEHARDEGGDDLAALVAAQEVVVEELRAASFASGSSGDRRREWERKRDEAARHDRLLADVVVLEERLAAVPVLDVDGAHAKATDATAVLRIAEARVRDARALARGEFDGRCPVGGMECPVKDKLNADVLLSGNRVLLAEAVVLQARQAAQAPERERALAEAAERERSHLTGHLASLRDQLADSAPTRPSFSYLPEPTVPTRVPLDENVARLERLRTRKATADRALARAVEAEAAMEALAPDMRARREALLILGPGGAQRRLAESFLTGVQDAANELLGRAGVDLTVSASWSREVPGVADACPACGDPFPSSKRVKACLSCGAARGPRIEQKLRVAVDPPSGGNVDLAGLAVRLAASAWLRARTGSAWGVACLDEPFAALDAHNRQGVARHLAAMLADRYGFEQAFVSAHDPGVLATLPRRIKIVGSAAGSRVEVSG